MEASPDSAPHHDTIPHQQKITIFPGHGPPMGFEKEIEAEMKLKRMKTSHLSFFPPTSTSSTPNQKLPKNCTYDSQPFSVFFLLFSPCFFTSVSPWYSRLQQWWCFHLPEAWQGWGTQIPQCFRDELTRDASIPSTPNQLEKIWIFDLG